MDKIKSSKRTHYDVRDPIHDWIIISKEEAAIIDTSIVQRLRWISQLSFADTVFIGGTHNRFSHSLGVMHISGRYAEQVFLDNPNRDYLIQVARIAGLLHDIGHGVFSHAFDNAIYYKKYNVAKGHDVQRLHLIHHLEPQITACGIKIEDIIGVWTKQNITLPESNLLHEIIQGIFGADRMDFILRDSYFTGTRHFGTISTERIIRNTFISADGNNFIYSRKIFDDIHQMINGRMFMYDATYHHKTCNAIMLLLEQLLNECAEDLNLFERIEDISQFVYLNDYTFIGEVMVRGNERAKKICERILTRKLPKMIYEKCSFEKCSNQEIDMIKSGLSIELNIPREHLYAIQHVLFEKKTDNLFFFDFKRKKINGGNIVDDCEDKEKMKLIPYNDILQVNDHKRNIIVRIYKFDI